MSAPTTPREVVATRQCATWCMDQRIPGCKPLCGMECAHKADADAILAALAAAGFAVVGQSVADAHAAKATERARLHAWINEALRSCGMDDVPTHGPAAEGETR